MIRLQFDCDSIAFNTRRCQSNQLNAKSIEHNWTQSNDCNSIAERNRNSIEYYPGFAVRLSNVIESIEYYGKFQFNWFDSEELTKTDRHNHGKFFQNINARGWVVQANSWRNCAIFYLTKFNPIWDRPHSTYAKIFQIFDTPSPLYAENNRNYVI